MATGYKIVMINGCGERCYVEFIFKKGSGYPEGMPCIGGLDGQHAEVFPREKAIPLAAFLNENWACSDQSYEVEEVEAPTIPVSPSSGS